MYKDKTIACIDCGNDFTFTAGEQEFYVEKGFDNEPRRCKDCRAKRKNNKRNSGNKGNRGPRNFNKGRQ